MSTNADNGIALTLTPPSDPSKKYDGLGNLTPNAPQSDSSSNGTSVTPVVSSASTPILCSETKLPRFSLFNKLPLELRLMVWEFALPGPRAIHFKLSTNKVHNFVIASELATTKVKVDTSIPGVLHAVQDSRVIALKHYEIAFDEHPKIQTMFFNFEHDYLHVSILLLDSLFAGSDMGMAREQTLSKVRNLMIGPSCQLQDHDLDLFLVHFFQSLKHLIVPHRFPLGDVRRVRKENAGREYFKKDRRTSNVDLPGMNVEYKTMIEISDMSRAMRRGD